MTAKTIQNSMLITVGSSFGASMVPAKYGGRGQLPTPRMVIGAGATYITLGVLDDFAPGVARPLAAVIAVTALTFYGAPILAGYFAPPGTKIQRGGPAATGYGNPIVVYPVN